MAPSPTPTTTSYAILGLLAIRPWTTYELINQVERSLRRFWPRAPSKLYEEPKKLVALGWARATEEQVGRRPRTRYRVTPKGRRALAGWLREPGAGPVLEFEQLLKIHLAGGATRDEVLALLDSTRTWVAAQQEENVAAGRAALEDRGAAPERASLDLLSNRFLADFAAMVASWADWATGLVEEWPDQVAEARPVRDEQEETVRIAARVSVPRARPRRAPPRRDR
jgi:PadR family transcriptional regulator, regulatory protein AphA